MNVPGIDEWIKHMSNSLVLIGFVIMIFAIVVLNLKGTNNKTIRHSLLFLFIIILGAEIVGFTSLFKTSHQKEKSLIMQESKGSQSPNIQGSRDVNITYGKTNVPSVRSDSGQTATDTSRLQTKPAQQPNVIQKSSGPQSPNVSGSGNVNISY